MIIQLAIAPIVAGAMLLGLALADHSRICADYSAENWGAFNTGAAPILDRCKAKTPL